jgi:hypothetical protein
MANRVPSKTCPWAPIRPALWFRWPWVRIPPPTPYKTKDLQDSGRGHCSGSCRHSCRHVFVFCGAIAAYESGRSRNECPRHILRDVQSQCQPASLSPRPFSPIDDNRVPSSTIDSSSRRDFRRCECHPLGLGRPVTGISVRHSGQIFRFLDRFFPYLERKAAES